MVPATGRSPAKPGILNRVGQVVFGQKWSSRARTGETSVAASVSGKLEPGRIFAIVRHVK
jgi:hypothetical protein